MWKKCGMSAWLLVVTLLLFGCGQSVQSGDHPVQSEPLHSQSQSPPSFELTIGDDAIRTFRGSYSWSYYDPEEKLMVGIETETISPQEMVNIEKARKVDRNAVVKLEFEEPPISYEVFVWDEDGNQNVLPTEFDLDRYEGKNIFEIHAQWEQGNAGYVFVLDVE